MIKLTPTQDLIMDLLVARYRLGESLWTLDSRVQKQAEALEAIGYIETMHGVVENTIRASLTEDGRKAYMSDSYTPPGGS